MKALKMVGSVDSFDFLSDLSTCEERNSIPIDCWQNICLSDIWIPSNLLPSRKKPSNIRATKGIFHVLEKRDIKIESFSVYSNSDIESDQEEIFVSDSEEDILGLDIDNYKKTEISPKKLPENTLADIATIPSTDTYRNDTEKDIVTGNLIQQYENVEMKENISNMKIISSANSCDIDIKAISKVIHSHEKLTNIGREQYEESDKSTETCPETESKVIANPFASFSSCLEVERFNSKERITNKQTLNQEQKETGSHISLNEILDNTVEINIKDCNYNFNNKFSDIQEKKFDSNQRRNNKKEKKKKKASKYVPLDEFLDDYDEDDLQDSCCNDYYKKVLIQKGKNPNVQIRSKAEFPDLVLKDLEFIHAKNPEISFKQNSKNFAEVLSKADETHDYQNTNHNEKTLSAIPVTESTSGKIIIENIPGGVCQDDIYSLLCGYGEIKNFSLVPDGEFLKAFVEIDLMCDIDWIIDCLNGTEPFGASSKMLICYKQ